MPTNIDINRAFVRIGKRAEAAEPAMLVQTFVDIGTLLPSISVRDHQIIYGRRGTGKTHALIYVLEQAKIRKASTVYVDLRRVGSNGGIYADIRIPLDQRATRLLLDVLGFVHETLVAQMLGDAEADLSTLGPLLDKLGQSITEVGVSGDKTVERSGTGTQTTGIKKSYNLTLAAKPALELGGANQRSASQAQSYKVTEAGAVNYRVHFGSVSKALADIANALARREVILVLDEWVAVPLELQPFLADLIRRAVFPVIGITVKIAAIEQRASFKLKRETGDYIGIEVGADASTDVNLDDFMVFENNAERAITFFRDLVFKHYQAETSDQSVATAPEMVRLAFTQKNAFDEFVRAAEGVPRDAINILSISAQNASEEAISIPHIRKAARDWYLRGKEATVNSEVQAQKLLHWIIDQVIGRRRARAFLLLSGSRHPLVDALFDDRVLHLMKRGISAQDKPGLRYDAYKIDYGAYVDLVNTDKSPQGLLVGETEGEFVEVPPNDYRAIRRSILDLRKFDDAQDSEVLSVNVPNLLATDGIS